MSPNGQDLFLSLESQPVYKEGSEGIQGATAKPPDGLRPLVASAEAKPSV